MQLASQVGQTQQAHHACILRECSAWGLPLPDVWAGSRSAGAPARPTAGAPSTHEQEPGHDEGARTQGCSPPGPWRLVRLPCHRGSPAATGRVTHAWRYPASCVDGSPGNGSEPLSLAGMPGSTAQRPQCPPPPATALPGQTASSILRRCPRTTNHWDSDSTDKSPCGRDLLRAWIHRILGDGGPMMVRPCHPKPWTGPPADVAGKPGGLPTAGFGAQDCGPGCPSGPESRRGCVRKHCPPVFLRTAMEFLEEAALRGEAGDTAGQSSLVYTRCVQRNTRVRPKELPPPHAPTTPSGPCPPRMLSEGTALLLSCSLCTRHSPALLPTQAVVTVTPRTEH